MHTRPRSPETVDVYLRPPRRDNAAGQERRLGLELEFAGLDFDRAVSAAARALEAEVDADEDALVATLRAHHGPFRLEIDAHQLRDKTYLDPLTHLGLRKSSPASRVIDDAVRSVALEFVPLELVTPPIPWSQVGELEPLWHALHDAGAEGTRSSVFRAFGLHLNPEAPDMEVDTTLAVLRAYLLLEPWLIARAEVDLTRELSPFVRAFPEGYRRHVLAPDYAPDWTAFVDDYVRDNPTRNRKLDLLPLMRHATGRDLGSQVRDWALVKGRPTYHYRLPNCEIGDARWSPAPALNDWVYVERLADDRALLADLSRRYLAAADDPLRFARPGWGSMLVDALGEDLDALRGAP